jgi:hypothetical protein
MRGMKADISLIRSFTPEDARTWRPVAVTHFQKNDRHLYFINARHERGDNTITCKTIRSAFRSYSPEFIIVEGVKTEDGLSPPDPVRIARKDFPQVRDNEYAAYWADKNKTPFIGGEPSSQAIFSAMAEQGYAPREVMGFYALRDMPIWHEKINDEHAFKKNIEDFLKKSSHFSHIPETERLTYEDFETWYRDHQGERQHFTKSIPDLAPFSHAGADYFEKLNDKLALIRDRNLGGCIAAGFDDYKTILAIYGDAHLMRLRPVLENMLGADETIYLVPDRPPPAMIRPESKYHPHK